MSAALMEFETIDEKQIKALMAGETPPPPNDSDAPSSAEAAHSSTDERATQSEDSVSSSAESVKEHDDSDAQRRTPSGESTRSATDWSADDQEPRD